MRVCPIADKCLAELGINDLPWSHPDEAVAYLEFWETHIYIDFSKREFMVRRGGAWGRLLRIKDNREHLLENVTQARAWWAAVKAQQKKIRKRKTNQTKGATNGNDR